MGTQGVNRRSRQWSTIALLTCLLTAGGHGLKAHSAEYLESDFNDPARCAGCHTDIFSQWQGSMHSYAAEDPIFRKFYEMVVRDVGEAAVSFCMKCHSPVAVLRQEVPPASGEHLSALSRQGVFCDFCHTVTPLGIGNAAFDTTFSETKHGPRDKADSPAHATETAPIYRQSEFCGMCHNVTHPLNGRPIERTYQEWKESPYNTGDSPTTVHCQDCHMRQFPGNPGTGAGEITDHPGKAAAQGPDRPHVWTHYFVGGNTLYPGVKNSEQRRALAEERLRGAAEVEIIIDNAPSEPGELGTFRVKVHNVGAGHKLPTGLSEVREMWLEVRVVDATGRVLLESGQVGENGVVDPTAAIFKTFLGIDRSDVALSCCFFAVVEANKLLSAQHVTRDRRIPPKGYDQEKYAFVVPPGSSFPLTIQALLNYRSMSQAFADFFLPVNSPPVPVVRMAEAEHSITSP